MTAKCAVVGKYGPSRDRTANAFGITPVSEVPPGPARAPRLQGCVGGWGIPPGSIHGWERAASCHAPVLLTPM